MKNKEITMYELIRLIKDGRAPKKICYQGNYLEFDGEDYKYYEGADTLSDDSLVKYIAVGNLKDTVEILPEENDEWEDIEDITLNDEVVGYSILKEWLDFTPNDNEQKICSCIETLGIVMNKLIKNQKYLKAMVESLQRPFTDEIRVDTPKWIEDLKK